MDHQIKNTVLPKIFKNFKEYQDIWIPLFKHETMNMLTKNKSYGKENKDSLVKITVNQNAYNKELYIKFKISECNENVVRKSPGILDRLKRFDLVLISR